MISLAEPLRTRRVPLRSQRLCERIFDLLGTTNIQSGFALKGHYIPARGKAPGKKTTKGNEP